MLLRRFGSFGKLLGCFGTFLGCFWDTFGMLWVVFEILLDGIPSALGMAFGNHAFGMLLTFLDSFRLIFYTFGF